MAVNGKVAGSTLGGEKDKALEVETDGRDAIVRVGKEAVRLDRHALPTAIQLLQAAFLEVN